MRGDCTFNTLTFCRLTVLPPHRFAASPSFEVTKLCDSENVSSHLIRIGSFNILCDLPLNPKEILNFNKKRTKCSGNMNGKEYIKITNLEAHSLSNKLLLNISDIPLKIHIILISCCECFMGLPIFCKYFDISDTQVICTKLTFTFSLCAVDNLQRKENYLPPWDEESLNENMNGNIFNTYEYFNTNLTFKNSLHLLSYKEKITLKQNNEVIHITPYSSGYSLGSCNFFIETDSMSTFVINKSSYNIKRHPESFDSSPLEKTDFVLFTAYLSKHETHLSPEVGIEALEKGTNLSSCKDKLSGGDQYMDSNGDSTTSFMGKTAKEDIKSQIREKLNFCIENTYKDTLNKICSIVLKTVKRKGCVLIPVDFHFIYFLELVELIGVIISKYLTKEEQVLIFGIISNVHNVINQAELSAEWVEESRKKKCSKMLNPQGPFSIEIMIKNNRLIIGNCINDVSKHFRYPCVCFVQDSTLRFFESSLLLEKWGTDENNSLILIDPSYDPISVLSPFHIYKKKINPYYCPLFWDLTEINILDIMNSNPNKKCVYILSHNLEKIVTHNYTNVETNCTNANENRALNKDETSKTVKYRYIDVENGRKTDITQHLHPNGNSPKDVNRSIIYISPLKKKEIIFNSFLHLNQKMHPVCFTPDGSQNLENILAKIDDFYCARVKCSYWSTFFGDYIKEGDIEELKNEDGKKKIEIMEQIEGEETKKETYPNAANVNLMFGSINVEDVFKQLLQLGYNNDDLTVQYAENDKFRDLEKEYIWCIRIHSINSKITCYSKYDIEVFSSSEKLRQQIGEILQKLTKSF
ncbi:conserved Plasmodium protein, unknown function [Plasmodium ovale wallikeri]|uniref:Metallo-beta-lactamase domain-containing protein n=1 Tax=Plasmodium ovale wallikeri TaxID=864142 RepID=A0A1A8YSD4_PLAOA|nr:conserved Plasmodium protein, unknown function [Plasmodium ovale wallikeri]